MNKKIKLILIFIALVICLGAFAFYKSQQDAQHTYKEAQAHRGSIEVTVLSTGTVNPENRVDIKPPVAGRVDSIIVDEGVSVKKGEILAWMSSTERAALIDSARSHGEEELKKWEKLYRPIPILAPVNGVIIVRKVESGQTFSSGDTLYTMSDRLIVRAQLDETDISQVKLGQKAEILLDAYPDVKIDGEVVLIAFDARTVNNVTTYDVNVLPKEVPPYMRSGMTANVSFHIEFKKNVLLIPSEALKVHDSRYFVLTHAEDEKVHEREVEIGINDGKKTEVISGLSEGENILIPQNVKKKTANGSPFSPMGTQRKHP